MTLEGQREISPTLTSPANVDEISLLLQGVKV